MSVETVAPPVVPVQVATTDPITTQTVVIPPVDDTNNPLRQVREQLNAEKQARKDLEDQLAAIKRDQMNEIDRLKLEAEEGKGYKTQLDDAVKAAELAFQQQIDSLPEQFKSVAELGCAGKTYTERMAYLAAFRATIPAPVQAAGTVTGGSTVNGGMPTIKIDPRNPFGSYESQVGFKSAGLDSLVAK